MSWKKEHFSNQVKEKWNFSPELPLAYNHPENIITWDSVQNWIQDLERFNVVYPNNQRLAKFLAGGSLDSGKLLATYQTELRLLSRNDTVRGLQQFSQEIIQNFSPEDSLFYFPPESASAYLMYNTMLKINPDVANYGYVHDSFSRLLEGSTNSYNKKSIDEASAFIYVDDWVLSGEHIGRFLTKDVAGRFNTFHLAVSDAGLNFFNAASQHLSPRFLYRIKSDDPKSFFAEVPVYGSHKIPDRIPEYYAGNEYCDYSIFGKYGYSPIAKNTRLIDHSGSLY